MQTMGEGDPLKHGLICRLSPEEVKLVRDVMLRLKGSAKSRLRIANDIVAALVQAGVRMEVSAPLDLPGEIGFTN